MRQGVLPFLFGVLALGAPPALTQVGHQAHGRVFRSEGFASPTRIAVAPGGDLLVSDYRRRKVLVVDPATRRIVHEFPVGGRPVAVGALDERIYVGNESTQAIDIHDRLGIYAGRLGGASSQVGEPSDLAIDPGTGRLFVVDALARDVKVFDLAPPNGQLIATISGPGSQVDNLVNPTGIAVDPSTQEIYVSDFGELDGTWPPARVLIFGYDGTYHEAISGQGGPTGHYFDRPQGLALGAQPGHVFVVDSWRGEVVVMDRSTGAQVGLVGAYGKKAGELFLPLDTVVSGPTSDLFVISNRTRRIEVYPAGGQL